MQKIVTVFFNDKEPDTVSFVKLMKTSEFTVIDIVITSTKPDSNTKYFFIQYKKVYIFF